MVGGGDAGKGQWRGLRHDEHLGGGVANGSILVSTLLIPFLCARDTFEFFSVSIRKRAGRR